jgi:hypothetical protein
MSYADFRASRLGQSLAPLLADPEVIGRMEALSRRGRPAVEAIGAKVAELAPDLDDTSKQHIGRLVRDTLSTRGWRPIRKARVAPGNLFSWGAVYDRTHGKEDRHRAALEGVERARAILRSSGVDLGTVDDFLADRRRDWGEDD